MAAKPANAPAVARGPKRSASRPVTSMALGAARGDAQQRQAELRLGGAGARLDRGQDGDPGAPEKTPKAKKPAKGGNTPSVYPKPSTTLKGV